MTMKECFGMQFGGLVSEELVHDEAKRQECLFCQDFEACFKVTYIRNLQQNRGEVKRGVRGIRNSLGGSHRENPFG